MIKLKVNTSFINLFINSIFINLFLNNIEYILLNLINNILYTIYK